MNINAASTVQRDRGPLSSARLLVLMRLAQTFGSAAAFEAHLKSCSLTMLRGFAIPELPDVAASSAL